jgi:hypothetical protein
VGIWTGQGGDHWRALMNTVMSNRFSIEGAEFFGEVTVC